MDNTLIDDRRIHVDFSQSVAKLWGQYRHGKRSNGSKGKLKGIKLIMVFYDASMMNMLRYCTGFFNK